MRAFVRLREMIASHKELAQRLDELERKYDAQFKSVFDAIRQLMTPEAPSKRRIGKEEAKSKTGPFLRSG
jgi:DnaJ-domain-containing protein 1